MYPKISFTKIEGSSQFLVLFIRNSIKNKISKALSNPILSLLIALTQNQL